MRSVTAGRPLPDRDPGRGSALGRNFIWHMFQARPGRRRFVGRRRLVVDRRMAHGRRIKFGSIEVAEVPLSLHFSVTMNFAKTPAGRPVSRRPRPSRSDLVLETTNGAGEYRGRRRALRSLRMLGGEDGVPHDCRRYPKVVPARAADQGSRHRDSYRRLP